MNPEPFIDDHYPLRTANLVVCRKTNKVESPVVNGDTRLCRSCGSRVVLQNDTLGYSWVEAERSKHAIAGWVLMAVSMTAFLIYWLMGEFGG